MAEFLTVALAYAVTWVLVPVLRRVAIKWQFVDLPNQRKIHQQPLPLLGGVAIMFGFMVASATVTGLLDKGKVVFIGLVIGALLLFSVGLIDDYFKTRGKDFPAAPRFVVQIVAAAVVAAFGGRVRGVSVPFEHGHFIAFPLFISILVTVIWIVGVINVFNFLDGLDGLAAGIAAISGTTLILIALLKGDTVSALWAASVTGSALGFLRHNFYPARIIMGDAGSTLLGFLLSTIAVVGAFKSATIVSVFVPILALGVPIFDGLRVVTHRALRGQPVYKADRTHGHHYLLNLGLTQVQTVTFMYLVSICFSLASLIVVLIVK